MKDVPGVFFWQFFLLNLISDYVVLGINPPQTAIYFIPGLAAITAWLEALIFKAIAGHRPDGFRKGFGYVWYWLLLLLHNAVLFTDVFMLVQFKSIFSQQALDLILGTNPKEAEEFITTYLTVPVMVGGIAVIVLFNCALYYAGRAIADFARRHLWIHIVRYLLVLAGAAVFGYMVYGYVRYRSGAQIPTFTAPTRVAYSFIQRFANNRRTERLLDVCRNAQVKNSRTPDFDIVFVLGESFSVYHSPLYGYNLPTTPNQSKWVADSTMTVFTDVVTTEDWTQKVLTSIFCPGESAAEFGGHPLFPVLLRKAGWPVRLYDNEFLVSKDSYFFSRPDISALMFDSRNDKFEKYDGDLVAKVEPKDSAAFTMIHLMGQHFQYIDRYPAEYSRFSAKDYDPKRFSAEQREILARYDNATYYNDAVLGQIIDKFANRDAIVVYVSDHGEEVYDCRDYFGHGNAVSADAIDYQIRVPMMIWTSPTFRREHPELQEAIDRAADKRISTNDMAHFFLDLAGVSTPEFKPSRSFINAAYDANRQRVVLNSIDFDLRPKRAPELTFPQQGAGK